MHLKSLQVNQFKSYEEARFSFISEINCIVGENGIGKKTSKNSRRDFARDSPSSTRGAW